MIPPTTNLESMESFNSKLLFYIKHPVNHPNLWPLWPKHLINYHLQVSALNSSFTSTPNIIRGSKFDTDYKPNRSILDNLRTNYLHRRRIETEGRGGGEWSNKVWTMPSGNAIKRRRECPEAREFLWVAQNIWEYAHAAGKKSTKEAKKEDVI